MRVEDLVRDLAPQVLGALVRRHGQFDACEDAVQEALLTASERWPVDGVPDNPRAWLTTVASRRVVDDVRSATARRRREETAAALAGLAPDTPAPERAPGVDDSLVLLFLCCHPAVTPASQVALTLRAVGGLTTAEIAAAFLVPDATMGARISRAKQQIRAAGARFAMPPAPERSARLAVVLHVLYLVFNEGYTATSGDALVRTDLASEAIRLTRMLHRRLPDDGEVAGLLALMLLTDARRPARTGPEGDLVPLAEQDRSRWDHDLIAEGTALVGAALTRPPLGPYQLQAAIAALHDEAADTDSTDWPQIAALYTVLDHIAPNPVVSLNRAVAVAMTDGPEAGLCLLDELDDGPLATQHRLPAVRAHLLELAGDADAARGYYRLAAQRTASSPERRYLLARAATPGGHGPPTTPKGTT
ncbi:sigma factor-like helix-turn-helix DNA-binding protein [Actinomycetospora chlora]|uniref:Sigma factor-like helix-turn-helix DNA-binding protein n=1 Tax=Actinomycetospora chlora TaxID=663608 RepID=A0ABP9A9E4_9PSEU